MKMLYVIPLVVVSAALGIVMLGVIPGWLERGLLKGRANFISRSAIYIGGFLVLAAFAYVALTLFA